MMHVAATRHLHKKMQIPTGSRLLDLSPILPHPSLLSVDRISNELILYLFATSGVNESTSFWGARSFRSASNIGSEPGAAEGGAARLQPWGLHTVSRNSLMNSRAASREKARPMPTCRKVSRAMLWGTRLASQMPVRLGPQ